MKMPRNNSATKTAAFLLCLFVSSAAVWLSAGTIHYWDDLWFGGEYDRSDAAYQVCSARVNILEEVLRIQQRGKWSGGLSYSEQGRLKSLSAYLDPETSNFRYQVHDESGKLLGGNLPAGQALTGAVGDDGFIQMKSITISTGTEFSDQDYFYWDEEETGRQIWVVATADGPVYCDPQDTPANRYNKYGWFSDGVTWSRYSSTYDTRVKTAALVVEYGVADPMLVQDDFYNSRETYYKMQTVLPEIAAAALFTLCLTLGLLIFLCRSAGRQEGTQELTLSWQDRIPYDLYLVIDTILIAAILGSGDTVTYSYNQSPRAAAVVTIAIFTLLSMLVFLALLLTTAVRLKTHTLLRNTLIWKLCSALVQWVRNFALNWPITKRPILLFVLYLLGTLLTSLTLFLIPVYQGAVLYLLCRWVAQWRAIREGTAHIVGGNPDFKIATGPRMFRDLREHAEQLNDLGSSIGTAVEERLKSERLKSELITNVSHDLKTPLTSIINYVDLLKKAEIQNPQALEYLEVLDRKSQRLKKLTEDLVEASKASTGNLTVNRERLGVVQLLQQALAEYEHKFEQKRLEVVPTLHPGELYVEADGRHLWRIIDNLLGNCYKYALEGTRIYLDATRWDGTVTLSIKNVSKQQLNIPADQLMERFVRGEESRSTEGSGLGLSIARSLTELQGGVFRLAIDGDLFKAIVSFPEAPVAVPPQATLPPHSGGTPNETI